MLNLYLEVGTMSIARSVGRKSQSIKARNELVIRMDKIGSAHFVTRSLSFQGCQKVNGSRYTNRNPSHRFACWKNNLSLAASMNAITCSRLTLGKQTR